MFKWTRKIWRYRLDNPIQYKSEHLIGVEFANEWITIKDGSVRVQEGYAWDGCSPTWRVFGLWLGVPDGPRTLAGGKPQSYYATLVHDALCQFRPLVPIDKASVIALFKHMLREGGFPPWRASLYATFVKWFGPQEWPGLQFEAVQLRTFKTV